MYGTAQHIQFVNPSNLVSVDGVFQPGTLAHVFHWIDVRTHL